MVRKRLTFIRSSSLELDRITSAYARERSGHNEDPLGGFYTEFRSRREQLERHGRVPGEISRGRLRAYPLELSDGLIWIIFCEDAQKYWVLHPVRRRLAKLKRNRTLPLTEADWRIAEDRMNPIP